jgi:hypothetical protein
LEANTGIRSGLQMTFAGYLIDKPVLRKSLRRWTNWFLEHYPYLYWDSDRQLYAIDKNAEREGVPTRLPTVPANGRCDPPQPDVEKLLGLKVDEPADH